MNVCINKSNDFLIQNSVLKSILESRISLRHEVNSRPAQNAILFATIYLISKSEDMLCLSKLMCHKLKLMI